MKKLLVPIFSILVLFLSGTNVWAAKGVDCSNIEAPNLLDYRLVKNIQHKEKRLGTSLMYERDPSDILSYISFDNDIDVLDQKVLDFSLNQAVNLILQRYSSEGIERNDGSTLNENNYELQDDKQYLNMEKFNELGMQKFINKGVFMTSIEKNSSEPIKKMEIITVGTDGYCIRKFRWTAWIDPEMQPLSNNTIIEYFEGLLIDFYRGFIAINDISSRTSNVVWSADFRRGSEAAQRGDFATALREWKPLAEQGDSKAQFGLGFLYRNGHGVKQDYKTAVKWYTLSAEQGYGSAQFNLGIMYAKGEGVPEDGKTAVKWYTLAAEQGDDIAQVNLGVMYAIGIGVIQDSIYAYMWFHISDPNEEGNGSQARDRMAQEMTAAEIATAQKLARECVAKNYKGC